MQVVDFNNSQMPEYKFKRFDLNKRQYNTEQNLNFTFINAFSALEDIKISNFSILGLTKRNNLATIFTSPSANRINSFTTTLIFNAYTNALYLCVDESTYNTGNQTGVLFQKQSDNSCFFDITILSDFTCKVSHSFMNEIRYLTVDSQSNLTFVKDAQTDFLGLNSPQIFLYLYDKPNNLLVLYKKNFNIPYIVSVSNNILILTNISTAQNVNSIPQNSIIKIKGNLISNFLVEDYNAEYTKNFKSNTLDVDNTRSLPDIQKSFIIHNEYFNNTLAVNKENVIELKNSITSENINADYDNYLNTDYYNYRNYKKLLTNIKQENNNNTLQVSYENFNTPITLKPDSITYFHIPYDITPYQQININNTLLSFNGAIAGNTPQEADKIFKKCVNNVNDLEQNTFDNTGQFLCSWLSGANDKTLPPIWVDRYFNPKILTPQSALIYKSNNVLNSVTITELQNDLVFDIPSNLYFEPGSLYAYHHIGNNDMSNYLLQLSGVLIINNFSNFFDGNVDIFNGETEFQFTGKEYSVTDSVSSIFQENQFTISFDVFNNNWTKPFANQVLGNFIQSGIGIYNQNNITPFLYYWSNDVFLIYNTDFNLLYKITYESDIRGIFRKENLNDYYVITKNGKIIQTSVDGTIKYKTQNPFTFDSVYNTFNTTESGFILYQGNFQNKIACYNFDTHALSDITTNIVYLSNTTITTARTINFINNNLYANNGTQSLQVGTDLYVLDSNRNNIYRWDTNTLSSYAYFTSLYTIYDCNIDKDGNFWVVYNQKQGYKVSKIGKNKTFLFETVINSNLIPINIDFLSELVNGIFSYTGLVTFQEQTITNQYNIEVHKLDLDGNVIKTYTNNDLSNILFNTNVANSRYNNRVFTNYNNSVLNVFLGLKNLNDFSQKNVISTPSYDLSQLDRGYHNFCVVANCVDGILKLYINGIEVASEFFTQNFYIFDNISENYFYIGTVPFFNTIPLNKFTKQPNNFLMGDVSIKNLHIYNKSLTPGQISILSNVSKTVKDLILYLPTNKKTFIDDIEQYITYDVPGYKSSLFNIIIKNTNITDTDIRKDIEDIITSNINNIIPGYTKLNNIIWT